MVSRHIYHYYASYERKALRTTIDGLLFVIEPLRNMDQYRAAKQVIVHDLPDVDPEHLVIKSLSFIGMESE